jgi:L-ascorbate metabolism protein UlaG (beta-lactamase superfamily)
MYQVIASGSTGNAVIYMDSILVDCGVPFSKIEPFMNQLQIVLLTHIHGDHFNLATIQRLAFERPGLRFGCCEWLGSYMKDIRNVDYFEIGKVYDYSTFQISPVKLYHDVSNCGYRIFKEGTKIFHATDTAHLDGITASGYDLYAIESNYDEETIQDVIQAQQDRGEYSYQKGVMNSHLSEQQARDFIFKNRGENSKVLRLHETSTLSII